MTVDPLIQSLKGKLVVSVQAYMGEPLRTPETMAQMSRACELGGAAAIRCQGLADIAAIKGRCEVPVIGLWKDGHEGVYITPTLRHARACVAAGADIVAIDATDRPRPDGKTVEDTFGPISVLVNNAGVAGQALFQDVTDEMWERYFGVNLNGARNTIQAVLPNMLHEKSGCIVNISSIWGQHGASCEVTYSCTKHALIGLTRSLAMELAPSGIRVNCVAPGVIETDMVKVLGEETLKDLAEQTPLGRLGKPEDIAAAVAYLASDKASFVTGQVLAVDGAFVL